MCLNDLNTYNVYSAHGLWRDFDNYENTCNTNIFDEPDLDNFISNLNDWN